jgi:signal peptidase II
MSLNKKLMATSTKRFLRIMIISAVLLCNVGCDQISKAVVRNTISYDEHIGLLNNYLTLMKVENTGAFLSAGNSLPSSVRFVLLSLLPLFALGYGLFYLFSKTNISKITLTGFCFALGGGIGNIYDRLMFGSVTDFVHINFVIFQTGVFNMADVSIMTGALLILIHSFAKKKIKEIETQDHSPL